jgi:hypothetical protein
MAEYSYVPEDLNNIVSNEPGQVGSDGVQGTRATLKTLQITAGETKAHFRLVESASSAQTENPANAEFNLKRFLFINPTASIVNTTSGDNEEQSIPTIMNGGLCVKGGTQTENIRIAGRGTLDELHVSTGQFIGTDDVTTTVFPSEGDTMVVETPSSFVSVADDAIHSSVIKALTEDADGNPVPGSGSQTRLSLTEDEAKLQVDTRGVTVNSDLAKLAWSDSSADPAVHVDSERVTVNSNFTLRNLQSSRVIDTDETNLVTNTDTLTIHDGDADPAVYPRFNKPVELKATWKGRDATTINNVLPSMDYSHTDARPAEESSPALPAYGHIKMTLHDLLLWVYEIATLNNSGVHADVAGAAIASRFQDWLSMSREIADTKFDTVLTTGDTLNNDSLQKAIAVVNRKIEGVVGLTNIETLNSLRELSARVDKDQGGFKVLNQLLSIERNIDNLYRILHQIAPDVTREQFDDVITYAKVYQEAFMGLDYMEQPTIVYKKSPDTDAFDNITEGIYYPIHSYFLGNTGVTARGYVAGDQVVQFTSLGDLATDTPWEDSDRTGSLGGFILRHFSHVTALAGAVGTDPFFDTNAGAFGDYILADAIGGDVIGSLAQRDLGFDLRTYVNGLPDSTVLRVLNQLAFGVATGEAGTKTYHVALDTNGYGLRAYYSPTNQAGFFYDTGISRWQYCTGVNLNPGDSDSIEEALLPTTRVYLTEFNGSASISEHGVIHPRYATDSHGNPVKITLSNVPEDVPSKYLQAVNNREYYGFLMSGQIEKVFQYYDNSAANPDYIHAPVRILGSEHEETDESKTNAVGDYKFELQLDVGLNPGNDCVVKPIDSGENVVVDLTVKPTEVNSYHAKYTNPVEFTPSVTIPKHYVLSVNDTLNNPSLGVKHFLLELAKDGLAISNGDYKWYNDDTTIVNGEVTEDGEVPIQPDIKLMKLKIKELTATEKEDLFAYLFADTSSSVSAKISSIFETATINNTRDYYIPIHHEWTNSGAFTLFSGSGNIMDTVRVSDNGSGNYSDGATTVLLGCSLLSNLVKEYSDPAADFTVLTQGQERTSSSSITLDADVWTSDLEDAGYFDKKLYVVESNLFARADILRGYYDAHEANRIL